VSRYQIGKTDLDFTGARDSEWQWHQLDHMQVCTSLHIDNHASTPPLCFSQAGCPSCRPTNSVKAPKAQDWIRFVQIRSLPPTYEDVPTRLAAAMLHRTRTRRMGCDNHIARLDGAAADRVRIIPPRYARIIYNTEDDEFISPRAGWTEKLRPQTRSYNTVKS